MGGWGVRRIPGRSWMGLDVDGCINLMEKRTEAVDWRACLGSRCREASPAHRCTPRWGFHARSAGCCSTPQAPRPVPAAPHREAAPRHGDRWGDVGPFAARCAGRPRAQPAVRQAGSTACAGGAWRHWPAMCGSLIDSDCAACSTHWISSLRLDYQPISGTGLETSNACAMIRSDRMPAGQVLPPEPATVPGVFRPWSAAPVCPPNPPPPTHPPSLHPPCAVGVTYVHDRLHAQLYGEGVHPEEILSGRVAVPPELLPLYGDIEERASEARVRSRWRRLTACATTQHVGMWPGVPMGAGAGAWPAACPGACQIGSA